MTVHPGFNDSLTEIRSFRSNQDFVAVSLNVRGLWRSRSDASRATMERIATDRQSARSPIRYPWRNRRRTSSPTSFRSEILPKGRERTMSKLVKKAHTSLNGRSKQRDAGQSIIHGPVLVDTTFQILKSPYVRVGATSEGGRFSTAPADRRTNLSASFAGTPADRRACEILTPSQLND